MTGVRHADCGLLSNGKVKVGVEECRVFGQRYAINRETDAIGSEGERSVGRHAIEGVLPRG